MTVLVAHASKRGGTEGIAHSIASALRDAGHDVGVEAASSVGRIEEVR